MTSFEDVLTDVQTELVAVSLEYAAGVASDIYMLCSLEGGVLSFDPFFIVDGMVVRRSLLPRVDTSVPRQRAMIKYGSAQLVRLWDSAREFGRPLPTQVKLHYAVVPGSLDAAFEYGPQYSDHPTRTVRDLAEVWQAEVQAQLDRQLR